MNSSPAHSRQKLVRLITDCIVEVNQAAISVGYWDNIPAQKRFYDHRHMAALRSLWAVLNPLLDAALPNKVSHTGGPSDFEIAHSLTPTLTPQASRPE